MLLLLLYFTVRASMARVQAAKHLSELNLPYLSPIEMLGRSDRRKVQTTLGRATGPVLRDGACARHAQPGREGIRASEEVSLLHDMDKLTVPASILKEPGPLTLAELERVKRHASIGAETLSAIEFPNPVVPFVRHHRENWDGTGRPDGVKGEAIPTQDRRDEARGLYWHGNQRGRVALRERQLSVDKPRPFWKKTTTGAGSDVAIPVYTAMQGDQRLAARGRRGYS